MTKSSLTCSARESSAVANFSTSGIKRGPWTPQEDRKLFDFIQRHGHGNWSSLPRKAGLQRCGKSCRLRWRNYLRPDIKRGNFSLQEDQTIIQLHALLGNKWSAIAKNLPKRTDNEIKNYWNTHLKKRLAKIGFDPVTHKSKSAILASACGDPKNLSNLSHIAQWESARLQAEARFADQSKLLRRDQFPAGLGCYEPQPTFSSAKPEPPMPQCLEIDDFAPWEALIMSNSLVKNGGSGGHEVSSFGNIFDGALGNSGDQFIVKSPALAMPCEAEAGMKDFDGVEFDQECGNNECSELLEAVLLQHNYSSNSTGFDIREALAFAQSDNNICGDDQNVNVGDRLSNMFML